MRLLLLEDDDNLAKALVRGLTLLDNSYEILRVSRLEQARRLVTRKTFDAALIDLMLPDANGCEAAYAMRKADPALALVAMTACAFDTVAMDLTAIGVQDFLQKGTVDAKRVHQVLHLAMVRQHEIFNLQRKASTDPLTGVMNRSKATEQIKNAIRHANQDRSDAAVFVIDVDDFKAVNDQYGHRAGDNLLLALVRSIETVIRPGDSIGRLGGDEFVVVVEKIRGYLDAASIAEKLLRIVSEDAALVVNKINFTVSIGIAMIPDDGSSVHEVLAHADQSLYRAKQNGKNICSFYSRQSVNSGDD